MIYPPNISLFKVNIGKTRKKCEICLKLSIKTPERRHWLTFHTFLSVFSVDIEQGEMLAGYFSLKKAKEKI